MSDDHLTNIVKLKQALRNHDWFYQFSDDHSVWQRGCRQGREINELIKLTGDEGKAIAKPFYDNYSAAVKGEKSFTLPTS